MYYMCVWQMYALHGQMKWWMDGQIYTHVCIPTSQEADAERLNVSPGWAILSKTGKKREEEGRRGEGRKGERKWEGKGKKAVD